MTSGTRGGVTTYATPTDLEVVITRVVAAPRRLVFDAWTNPKHVPQWLLGPEGWTMPVCEIDLPPRRPLALRLAQVQRDGDGNGRLLSGDRLS